jgi:hypothetical protein
MLMVIISNSSIAASAGKITGMVTDQETSGPIAYAQITFENSSQKIEVEANEYGLYNGSQIPTGKYQMRVSFGNRTFVIKNVHIYDGYATELNLIVSSNEKMPPLVEVKKTSTMLSAVQPSYLKPANNSNWQIGIFAANSSNDVNFYINGTTASAPANIERFW